MIPNWTNHLKDPDEKERFRKYLLGSKVILERQTQMVQDKEEELDQLETDKDQYNCPSWAALQADRNGFRRALRWIKKINNLDQKEN